MGDVPQSLHSILAHVVLPAISRVLPDDPLSLLRLASSPSPFVGPFANDEQNVNAIQLEIEVSGEKFIHVIYDPETFTSIKDSRDRLVSDLADWVAESSFGWGQKRD